MGWREEPRVEPTTPTRMRRTPLCRATRSAITLSVPISGRWKREPLTRRTSCSHAACASLIDAPVDTTAHVRDPVSTSFPSTMSTAPRKRPAGFCTPEMSMGWPFWGSLGYPKGHRYLTTVAFGENVTRSWLRVPLAMASRMARKSEVRRARTLRASGSPRRALNSMQPTPVLVHMNAPYNTPLNTDPSPACCLRAVAICSLIFFAASRSAAVMNGSRSGAE
mmetsp:Transcript_20723/g.42119  ORF Transcript_20723/g.42119 Transcript_20723/m.42119 type:complete len:222 (-) Transcript_20723:186-851(-)